MGRRHQGHHPGDVRRGHGSAGEESEGAARHQHAGGFRQAGWRLVAFGIVMPAVFLFVGWLVDGWVGTAPLFTIVGAFVGAGAGFYNLYRQLVVPPRKGDGGGAGGRGE